MTTFVNILDMEPEDRPKCPGCGGTVTFSPGDDNDPPITVSFECPDPTCPCGKE